MGKTLKYVSEFTFPSDAGYSTSAGKTAVKGYMRGGSADMKPAKSALKNTIRNEREELNRVATKSRDAGQEMSRVRSEMRRDMAEMKGAPTRKQYPVDRREPMVAMAKGGMTPEQQAKVGKVMGEFKAGDLHSGSGPTVRNRKQAIAIGLSEARAMKPKK